MKRKLLIAIFLFAVLNTKAQHTVSSGFGVESSYNETLLPYNYRGISINASYEFEQNFRNQWKAFANADLSVSFLKLKYNFYRTSLPSIDMNDYFAQLDYLFLKKVLNTGSFSFYAGIVNSIQSTYQTVVNNEIYRTPLSRVFLNLSLSEGLSLFFYYQLKKISFHNTFSYHLITGSLYPNMTNNTFLNGKIEEYFVLSSITDRSYIKNQFKIEFPMYVRGKIVSNFIASYIFRYEYSTTKDNKLKRLSNVFNFGIVFPF